MLGIKFKFSNLYKDCRKLLQLKLYRKQRGYSDGGEGSEGHMRSDGEPSEERQRNRNRVLGYLVIITRR